MKRLDWADVEVDPFYAYPDGHVDVLAEWSVLPHAVRDHLAAMLDQLDERTCEAEGCEQYIGLILHDGDEQHRQGVYWAWTTLVWAGDKITAVCEECSPSNFYPNL